MKAVLFVSFVLLNNPAFLITKATTFLTREVCEIQEGILNKPLASFMDEPLIIDLFGQPDKFVSAECYDLPHKKGPSL